MKVKLLMVMIIAILVSACSDNPQVVLEKFVPLLEKNQCMIKADGEFAQFDGYIDTGLTTNYYLAFEIVNYLKSTEITGGSDIYPTEGGDANKFTMERVFIEYDFHPGSGLNGGLWNRRTSVKSAVVNPDGSRQTSAIHVLTEEQLTDLRNHTKGFDWITSPLVITIRIEGETGGGQKIQTNTLQFNLIPVFIAMVQSGALYLEPAAGFPDPDEGNTISIEEYNAMEAACLFQDALINGCLVGQDSSLVNCHAGMGVGDNIEHEYNTNPAFQDSDGGTWICCPMKLPEKPKEAEEDAANP
ncbi:hypothetical protein KAH37_00950 [bacterium]|nr:hypothetical protein [bacterium]